MEASKNVPPRVSSDHPKYDEILTSVTHFSMAKIALLCRKSHNCYMYHAYREN